MMWKAAEGCATFLAVLMVLALCAAIIIPSYSRGEVQERCVQQRDYDACVECVAYNTPASTGCVVVLESLRKERQK
jgi:hypothetical protein